MTMKVPVEARRGHERAHGGLEGANKSCVSDNRGSWDVLEAVRACRSHKIRSARRGRMWASTGCESFECQWWLLDCCKGRESA